MNGSRAGTYGGNYVDCYGALEPFGEVWVRGLLIRGNGYLNAIMDALRKQNGPLHDFSLAPGAR